MEVQYEIMNLRAEQTTSKSVSLVWIPREQTVSRYSLRTILTASVEVNQLIPPFGLYSVHATEKQVISDHPAQKLDIDYNFKPGFTYSLTLMLTRSTSPLTTKTIKKNITFIKHYGIEDLKKLRDKAKEHCRYFTFNPALDQMAELETFHRDKPADYYNYIRKHRQGVMEVYLKDNNGHPGSPINGRLNGLFFSAERTPANPSFFGDKRLSVPCDILFHEGTHLYFADFYCNYQAHYVTLVITKPHTEADTFCQRCLLQLDIHDNPFLKLEHGSVKTFRSVPWRKVHLELFYTDNLNLDKLKRKGASELSVPSRGSSTPGGIQSSRRERCPVCKLE